MKKLMLATLLTVMSFQTFAQNRGEVRARGPLATKAYNIAQMIELRGRLLSPSQAANVRSLLIQVENEMMSGSDQGQGPIYDNHQGVVAIKGRIESTEYSFNVRDTEDLFNQCTSFVNSRSLTRVDDISVSYNYGSLETLRNDNTYWDGKVQVCTKLVTHSQKKGLRNIARQLSLAGKIESTEFHFKGNNFAEIFSQCEAFTNARSLTTVDDIYIVQDYIREITKKNSMTYWKGTTEVCLQVVGNN